MNYIKITHNDIANGPGVRTVLWVAGCSHHCRECHNPETWDPNAGRLFDETAVREIFADLRSPYRAGLTISGGDPLFCCNINAVTHLARMVRASFPDKTIWLYTGGMWEQVKDMPLARYIDILVDGEFVPELHSIGLQWCGSSNQRVIDVQRSLESGRVVLYTKEE